MARKEKPKWSREVMYNTYSKEYQQWMQTKLTIVIYIIIIAIGFAVRWIKNIPKVLNVLFYYTKGDIKTNIIRLYNR